MTIKQYRELIIETNTDAIDQLKKLISQHDFTFAFSDDIKVWRKGKANQEQILALVNKIGAEGRKIWRMAVKANGG